MTVTTWRLGIAAALIAFSASAAQASPIYWADWVGNDLDPGVGFTGQATITTPTSTVNVTYTNPQGVGFYQSSGGTNYWTPLNEATSPYTSSPFVDNYPGTDGAGNPTPDNATDIVALQFAGTQTLTFSQAIANPVFAYVSLNGNGYAFNRDFDILSFGDNSPGNSQGFWGPGTSFKNVVDLGGGVFEYQLLGTGEPHGVLRFTGSFDSVSWRSLSNEYWNGFTVGVAGTAREVFPDPPGTVPEPTTFVLLGGGLLAFAATRWRKR